MVVKLPKTKAGRRTIRLDARSVVLLQEHMKTRMKSGNAGSRFMFGIGEEFPDRFAIYYAFRRLCKNSGLPVIRLHDLRHTHATLLFALGVNPKVVSERLGHASIGITLQIYGHVLPAMESDAVDKFDRLLG
jgi:integrase